MLNLKFHTKKHKKGVSLILCISVMMVLSVMAITFVRIMCYERAASSNYSAHVDAKLTAYAGMERAIVEIFNRLERNGYINDSSVGYINDSSTDSGRLIYPYNPTGDYYDLDKASKSNKSVSLEEGILYNYHVSGIVGPGRYSQNGNFYSLKITNNAGKLNVNSHICSTSQQQSNNILYNVLLSLAKNCGLDNDDANSTAKAIRDPGTGTVKKLNSPSQLKEIIDSASDANETLKGRLLANLTTDSWIDKKTSKVVNRLKTGSYNQSGVPKYESEERAPVDVNYATEELLTALISNIKAKALFYNDNNTSVADDPDFDDGKFSIETKIQDDITPIDIDFSGKASDIAGEIISQRPFRSSSQFEKFIEDFLTNSSTLPSKPSSYSWMTDADWYDACQDALKSNFNPNTIENIWNANEPAHRRVAKCDIYQGSSSVTPTHTTEFCFSSVGKFNITSLARIVASGGNIVVGKSTIKAEVEFCDIIQHTLQKDFYKGSESASNYVTHPKNMVLHNTRGADNFAGRVEINPNAVGSGDITTIDFSETGITSNTGSSLLSSEHSISDMEDHAIREENDTNAIENNVVPDGIISRRALYTNRSDNRYFVIKSIKNYTTELRATVNSSSDTNIANYKGNIQFWCKLDVDPNSKIGCGLFSATLISAERKVGGDVFRDAIKFMVYKPPAKSGVGKIRISREYCCGYFDNSGTFYGTTVSSDGDSSRKYPRSDALVDVSGWKPHKWYHVAVSWKDSTGSINVWVNGSSVGSPTTEHLEGGKFCMLNERAPKNVMFFNGIYRRQEDKDGYFRFILPSGTADNAGREVHYPGNGTFDNFISDKDYLSGGSLSKARFNNITYSGTFDINATAESKNTKYILGPLKWTSYPYPDNADNVRVVCRTNKHYDSNGSTSYPDDKDETGFFGEGFPCNSFKESISRTTPLDYNASFKTDSQGLQTPTLDKVSLMLLYPYPKVSSIEFE